MKDFDEARRARLERDRSFQIGGQVLTYRPAVPPEALLAYNKAITGEVTATEEEWISIYDETILSMLEEGQEDGWKIVRDPKAANPLNVQDLNELLQWLLEEQTGRPTGQPSDSSTSSGGNGTQSKADSSSPGAASKEPVLVKP